MLPVSLRHPTDLQYGIQPSEHHMFEIDDRDYVRKLWKGFLSSSKDAEDVSVAQDRGDDMKWNAEKETKLAIFYER